MKATGIVALCLAFLLASTAVAQDPQPKSPGKSIEERVSALETQVGGIEEQVEGEPNDLRVYWKEGLRFETKDRAFRFKIGGRMHLDYISTLEDDDPRFSSNPDDTTPADEPNDRVRFRRARLYLSGTIYEIVRFKFQYDFAGGDADFKDVYMEVVKIPVLGAARVGQFKEPFSLEEQTSSNYITFMERSLMNVFSPARSTGIMAYDNCADKMVFWAAGLFRDSDDQGDNDNDGDGSQWCVTGRVVLAPIYEDKGNTVVHVGVAYSHRNPNEDELRYRQRPEMYTKSRFVDTWGFNGAANDPTDPAYAPGLVMAEGVDLYQAEAAVVFGSFSAQAEYTHAQVDYDLIRNQSFKGWYAEASFFLTGEKRNYEHGKGKFGRTQIIKNLGDEDGFGAIQVAARISGLDLNNGPIRGGDIHNFTAGVNWHLNPNTRVMLNYVHSDRDKMGPWQFIGARFQLDF